VSVTWHLHGGPKDGEIIATQEERSGVLLFHVLTTPWWMGNPDEPVDYRVMVYRARGEALAGHVYGDFTGFE
jgi:hypothetical protein